MSWWTPYLNNPSSVNKLQRQQLEDLCYRAQDHIQQLNEQKDSFSSQNGSSRRGTASLRVQSQTNTRTIYASTDKRVGQLVKTINSLNSDRTQVQKEIQVLQDMLAKINSRINKDKFTPADLLYSYTFENQQMKSICSSIIDLNSSTTDEGEHEDYLFILDLLSENTLHLLQHRMEKTKPHYEQRLIDYEDEISGLTAEKQNTQENIQIVKDKINNIVPPQENMEQFKDVDSVLYEIEELGDTNARYVAAKKNVEQLEEQKRIIENDLSSFESMGGFMGSVSSDEIEELRKQRDESVQERKELQVEHDSLQRHLMQLNDRIKASMPQKHPQNKRNPRKRVDVDLCTRIKNIKGFDPNDVGMVWNWSQSTRLEDLINEINSLEEHRKLLGNRRDSLERKIEQLIAINKNLDANILEYNDVIESANEKQGQIQSSDNE